MPQCAKIKQDGERCFVKNVFEDGFCLFHSSTEKAVELRKKGRFLGGSRKEHLPALRKVEVPYLRSVEDLIRFMNRQGKYRLTGKIDDGLWRVSLELCAGLMKAFEVKDIKGGIEALEVKFSQLIERAKFKGITFERPEGSENE